MQTGPNKSRLRYRQTDRQYIHTHFYTANDVYITQLSLSHVSVVPSLSLCSAPPPPLLPSWCVQVVRNVLTVDYHMSRYKTVVEELQREITELKTQLAQQRPLKSQFDKTEAAR